MRSMLTRWGNIAQTFGGYTICMEMCGSGCQDWYAEDYYTQSPKADPSGPLAGSERVYRGGDFSDPFYYLRSASRSKGSPDTRNSFIGVRLLRIR